MLKRSKINAAALIALGAVAALPVAAQDAAQRVEITGSSVRRIDAEGSLPVQVITKQDIIRSGATSTVDLLNKIPSVQGATGESSSVGGSTFGFSGVSIHNIGETRTLVLLNGHRLTQFGGQTLTGFAAAFDLNSLPLSAIERVEVLTDGASALYGADAIAGVVNFITKRNSTDGDATIGFSNTQHGGAAEKRFSVTKGFGSQDKEGFNLVLSYSHDERTKLNATQRDFGASGRVFFSDGGTNYRFQQSSASSIPANALEFARPAQPAQPEIPAIPAEIKARISPSLIATGVCAPNSFRVTTPTRTPGLNNDYCGFDFVSTLQIYPVRERDSGLASLTKAFGDHELFADLLISKTTQSSVIAPVPGGVAIALGSPLHDKYLKPLGFTARATANWRIYDLGGRTSNDEAKFIDFAAGSRGLFAGWDYNAAYTHSESTAKSDISGYPGANALTALLRSGKVDPFVGVGQQSAAGLAALNAVNFNGFWDGGTSKLDTLAVRGSRELMKMPAGPMLLGAGVNYNREQTESNPSLFAQGKLSDPVAGTLCDTTNPDTCDQRFGDSATSIPYSASRNSLGVFGELIVPVTKTLEASASMRFDRYSDFGNATTVKGSFKWKPMPNLLIRGSVGTGFHAPTVPQVAAAPRPYGVTSENYDCSADLQKVAIAQGAICRGDGEQYDQVAAGNKDLKPEKSLQGSLGIRFDPVPYLSLGADLWHVGIRDAFGQLPEQAVFASPLSFPKSWSKNKDIASGNTYVAFLADNQNLGKSYATGIDFDVSARSKTAFGDLASQLTLTYMVREDQQIEKDGAYFTAIGNNSPDLGVVTFRYQGRWATSLKTGAWNNVLAVNFKSGYKDVQQTVEVLNNAGAVTGTAKVQLDVKSYATLDWQTSWDFRKDMGLSFGVLNLLDEKPPLSLVTSGTNKGQQFGYDNRYYDPRGRSLYGNFTYRF